MIVLAGIFDALALSFWAAFGDPLGAVLVFVFGGPLLAMASFFYLIAPLRNKVYDDA